MFILHPKRVHSLLPESSTVYRGTVYPLSLQLYFQRIKSRAVAIEACKIYENTSPPQGQLCFVCMWAYLAHNNGETVPLGDCIILERRECSTKIFTVRIGNWKTST
jgi:hypothetical protein